MFFFKNYVDNEAQRLVPDLSLFLKKLNVRWKQVVCSFASIYFDSPQLAIQKSKLYKTLYYWRRDMLNFIFLEKGLGLVSSPHFVSDFSIKMFLMLHSINWPDFIVWFPLLLEILGNMCITSLLTRLRCHKTWN